ncbi:MAG TPA: bifunctional alpha,alpha-trehalose-phosphate synthase (UDP-forming)/trehalose-phosphatase [Anaerolineales bacterium]|jgi:trehalose 6-phosphate synthase/phosphatase
MGQRGSQATSSRGRLIIVSNRLPVSVERRENGLSFQPSVGGLATSLNALRDETEMLWLGWPGITPNSAEEAAEIGRRLEQDYGCLPLFLDEALFEPYYTGFSNGCLWPLFHYFMQYAHYDWDEWRAYEQVNLHFAERLSELLTPDDRVWIHDYHLMLLPALVRQAVPHSTIGFFLHIPFPSYELFRTLPWREELLEGLLGADLIGFHSFSYARHFNSSLLRILGLESEFGRVLVGERPVKVDTFPLGVDVDRLGSAHQLPQVQVGLDELEAQRGGRKIVLSVDRLDFTKGIVERLRAFSRFLDDHPDWRGRVSLVSICVPSRESVPEYQSLKRQVDELIGRINGRFSQPGWTPIWYLYRQLPFEGLVPFYLLADVALVTPLRDGMNLVAKEYLAARPDGTGVLVLSETAGSAEELGEALIVNPHDQPEIVEKLLQALTMPEDEQLRRNKPMRARLERYTTARWADDFLMQLSAARQARPTYRTRSLTGDRRQRVIDAYRQSGRRLLMLDYDGTLVGFRSRADSAEPDEELLQLLKQLAGDPKNKVVVISGRDHGTLDRWLGATGIDLVAEHGARVRQADGNWRLTEDGTHSRWQDEIRPVMEVYVDRTPGAYLEDKGSSLVWHYRQAEPELGSLRAKELIETLEAYLMNTPLHVMQGNKVIEVKQSNVNKGRAAQRWLSGDGQHDFTLAIGDDVTDEDLFEAMPDDGITVKVGRAPQSAARYHLVEASQVRELLRALLAAE